MPSPSLPTTTKTATVINTDDTEFLRAMLGPTPTSEQLDTIGRAWHVAQQDIDALKPRAQSNKSEIALHAEIRTAITAAKLEACINQHGEIRTPAIHTATDEQLTAWTEAYEQNLEQNYQDQLRITGELAKLKPDDLTREWLELRSELLSLRETFDRQAGFLWEAQEMSGLSKVLAAKGNQVPE